MGRLDVVVFKKPVATISATNAVLLLSATGGAFVLTGTTIGLTSDIQAAPTANLADIRKRFLASCSHVLALPPAVADMPTTLPQPTTGQTASTTQGLAVLTTPLGTPVLPASEAPTGLKLTARFVEATGQRLFYVLADSSGAAKPVTQAQFCSLFNIGSACLTDSPGSRTKTVNAYTIAAPTAVDTEAMLKSPPAGWPTDRPYWTAMQVAPSTLAVYDPTAKALKKPDSSTPDACYACFEVAVAPMWYRVNSSWDTALNVSVLFSDPFALEFPRHKDSNKLRVVGLHGVLAVESFTVMVD